MNDASRSLVPLHVMEECLRDELRNILNHPSYSRLSNGVKAGILLELENGGEYDPLG